MRSGLVTVGILALGVGAVAGAGCNDNSLKTAPIATPPDTTVTETYTQSASTPPVDVLWMVDNSGSMDDDQTALGNGFSAFIPYLQNLNLDFHLGIVTSDMDPGDQYDGRLVGTPKVMDATTPNLNQTFATNAAVGSHGSGVEQGLAAVKAALSDPLVSGENAGFLRDNALLEVVVLSDEDDSSILPGEAQPSQAEQANPQWCDSHCYPTASYVNFLLGLKNFNPGMVNFSAIVSTQASCASDSGAVVGSRYMAVASALHGAVGTICTSDYTPFLDQLGSIVASLVTAFPLGAAPNPSTITVTVNGSQVSSSDWHYDSGLNEVVFDPAHVPPSCAQVVITYQTADGSAGTTTNTGTGTCPIPPP